MAKSNAARNVQAPKSVKSFSILEWRESLKAAALSAESAGKSLMLLALAARGKVDKDVAREAFTEAFGQAYASVRGFTFEEASKAPSVRNRVSDAMAIYGCAILPDAMPEQLQSAAKACRDANPKAKRAPRAGGKAAKHEANPVEKGLGQLEGALARLAEACEGNGAAIDALGSLKDFAAALREALLGEEDEPLEGELVDVAA